MKLNFCSVPGCANKCVAHGLCNMHHKRQQRTGQTGPAQRIKGAHGGGHINSDGYQQIYSGGRLTYGHIVAAEKALGRPLPAGVKVHHVDENKSHNAGSNLVICPNEAYHRLLHQRMRAMSACGNPNHHKCAYCKTYAPPDQLTHNRSGEYWFHPVCHNAARRVRRALLKEKFCGEA